MSPLRFLICPRRSLVWNTIEKRESFPLKRPFIRNLKTFPPEKNVFVKQKAPKNWARKETKSAPKPVFCNGKTISKKIPNFVKQIPYQEETPAQPTGNRIKRVFI